MQATQRKRWPKGTWMKLRSKDLLRAFVGDPRKDPSRKMSGRRLARYVGVHPSFVDHLLAGRSTSCKPATAELIAEALQVPLDVLFEPSVPSGTGRFNKQKVA